MADNLTTAVPNSIKYDRKPDTYSGNLSLYPCDRCTSSKIRCNKVLPICENCEVKSAECTLNRLLKYKKRAPDNNFKWQTTTSNNQKYYSFVQVAYPQPESKSNQTKQQKNNLIHNLKFEISDYKRFAPFTASSVQMNRDIFKQISNITLTYNLYSLVSHPSKTEIRSKDASFVDISNPLTLLLARKIKYPKSYEKPKILKEFYIDTLNQCLGAYFKYENPFFYLFNKESFFTVPRSGFLLYAVALSGMKHLEETELNHKLTSVFEYQLFQYFLNSYSKISLDTLQALLVILVSLKDVKWINISNYFLNGYTNNLAAALGLHLLHVETPSSSWSRCKLEKWLAYSAIIQVNSLAGWSYLTNTYNIMDEYHCPSDMDLDMHLIKMYSLKDAHRLMLTSFGIHSGYQFKAMATAQQKIISKSFSEEELIPLINKITQELSSISATVVSHLENLKFISTHSCNIEEIDSHINLVHFLTSIGLYRAYSLPVHFGVPSDTSKLPLIFHYLLPKSLAAVSQICRTSGNLPKCTFLQFYIPLLCQTFVCLLLQQSYCPSQLDMQNALDSASKTFTNFKQSNANTRSVYVFLTVVNKIFNLNIKG